MIKPVYKLGIFILLIAACLLQAFRPSQKQNAVIVLHDEQLNITPKEFYIARIVDERDDKTTIGLLQPTVNKVNTPAKPYTVDLKGGGFAAINQFIGHSLPRNTKLRPVIISLKKCTIKELALAGGRVEGHVQVIMAFALERDDNDPLPLVEYTGSAVYSRLAGPPQEIEPSLRKMLANGLIYINNWMDRQAATSIKLAKSVKVAFTDYAEKAEGDTVYYSFKRPLNWNDFQSRIASSRYDAEVFPTIGYEEHTEVVNSVVRITLAIKVALPKSACWVKDNSRNDYVLNHEQRHFDIAKIAANNFIKKIKAENLPVSNYDGPINVLYLDSYREMTTMQKQYDDETRHGSDQPAQERWNKKIDRELGRESESRKSLESQ